MVIQKALRTKDEILIFASYASMGMNECRVFNMHMKMIMFIYVYSTIHFIATVFE